MSHVHVLAGPVTGSTGHITFLGLRTLTLWPCASLEKACMLPAAEPGNQGLPLVCQKCM